MLQHILHGRRIWRRLRRTTVARTVRCGGEAHPRNRIVSRDSAFPRPLGIPIQSQRKTALMQYGRRTKARNDEFEFLVVRNKAAARRKVVSEQSKVKTA